MADVIAAVVANPLGTDLAVDDADQVATIEAVDTDTVTSEFGKAPRWFGRWFAADDGSRA